MHRVAGGCCRPAGQRAGFADAFFEDLAIGGLAVAQHRANVLGLVDLAGAAVDAHLLEQIGHAEGACLVGHDGHHPRAQLWVFQQLGEHAHKGHGGAHLLAVGLQRESGIAAQCRDGHRGGLAAALRQGAAQGLAALAQVDHLGAVGGRFVEGQAGRLLVAERQVEALAKGQQVLALKLFLLVGGHAALAGLAHAIALLGLRQDHRGLISAALRGMVGSVDLDQIMPAALQAVDLFVAQALGQHGQCRVLAEEVVAVVAPVLGGKGLELAVHRLRKGLGQGAVGVAGEQAVPVAAPHQLDHAPAGAGKQRLQLIDDAAVAAHRAVQALQIAVDHPDQVVQLLAGGQRQGAHALGLVHLAVTEHAPDLARRCVLQAAVLQVAHEAGVVDRADRPQPHRPGGELPEVGHQPGVGVAAQALRAAPGGAELLPIVGQVELAQAALQKGPGIDAGRRMRLEEHQIALPLCVAGPEEMVEADLEEIGRAGIAGDVAAQLTMRLVGAHHHRQRVPAHDGRQPLLDGQIARKRRLLRHRDGVDIGRAAQRLPADGRVARLQRQQVHHLAHPLRAAGLQQRLQGGQPFLVFFVLGVAVKGGVRVGGRLGVHGARQGGVAGRVLRATVRTSASHRCVSDWRQQRLARRPGAARSTH